MIAISMSGAILALLVIGLWSARTDIARASGIDKVAALAPTCVAMSLAAFGAEHFSGAIPVQMVPAYMPWRAFWIYFVGFALVAAALSIATRIQMRWSGLLLGLMMFLFVAMLYLPSALKTGARITWTIVFRELSFGAGGWVLAGVATDDDRPRKILVTVGRTLIALAAIFFGVQHSLHPLGMPVVPLQKEMPLWIPAREVIDYLTGAGLVVTGLCSLINWKTRQATTYLGAWILLLIVAIYIPVMILALMDPRVGVKVEGLNYFADTLLFGGVILSLALSTTLRKSEIT